MNDFTSIILKSLLTNKEYATRVITFLEKEYFQDYVSSTLFGIIQKYIEKYKDIPTYEAIFILLDKIKNIPEEKHTQIVKYINDLKNQDENTNLQFLLDRTEEFCKEQSIYNAIKESICIIDGDPKRDRGEIPELLKKALSVSFDTNVGHDYFNDAELAYEEYFSDKKKLSFSIKTLDKITDGGVEGGTLNIVVGATHGGKTLMLNNFAANHVRQGKNVLYITLEMSESQIRKRLDSILLDIKQEQFNKVSPSKISKNDYIDKVNKLKTKTHGTFKVKQFPTGGAHTGHFRHLLNEYKLKQGFVPDVVYVDYINICASSRLKSTSVGDPYLYVKTICEELRGLAIEFDIPVFTATQLNRQGIKSESVSMSDVSDSIGTSYTADFMLGIVRTEELDKNGHIMCVQMKNRYRNYAIDKCFMLSADFETFKIEDAKYDYNEVISEVENKNQENQPKTKVKGLVGVKF